MRMPCLSVLFYFILFFHSHFISLLLPDIVRCSCFIMCSVFNCNWYIRWCAVASYSTLYVQSIVFVVSLYVSHSVHFVLFVKWLHFHGCILFVNRECIWTLRLLSEREKQPETKKRVENWISRHLFLWIVPITPVSSLPNHINSLFNVNST